MFLGHFALAFGAKRLAPAVSLGTLFLAAQLADLLWPTFLLLGVERVEILPGATAVTPLNFVSYPYSHSLVALAAWGAIAGGIHAWLRREYVGAVLIASMVVSHWVLDAVSHRPDMPIAFGPTRVGLGLWYSLPATVVVEALLYVAALAYYANATRARDRTGTIAFWSLVVFLALIYAANLLGPPPPNVTALAWTVQAMWLLVLWGYWVDRHREARA
jgi:hypothetical protein